MTTTTTMTRILSDEFTLKDEHLIFECVASGHRFKSAMLADELTIIGVKTEYRKRLVELGIGTIDKLFFETKLRIKHDDLIRAALEYAERAETDTRQGAV